MWIGQVYAKKDLQFEGLVENNIWEVLLEQWNLELFKLYINFISFSEMNCLYNSSPYKQIVDSSEYFW